MSLKEETSLWLIKLMITACHYSDSETINLGYMYMVKLKWNA